MQIGERHRSLRTALVMTESDAAIAQAIDHGMTSKILAISTRPSGEAEGRCQPARYSLLRYHAIVGLAFMQRRRLRKVPIRQYMFPSTRPHRQASSR